MTGPGWHPGHGSPETQPMNAKRARPVDGPALVITVGLP